MALGAIAAAALMAITPDFEGTKYKTYRDPGGVLTYCTGATENAMWGKTYTTAQCAAQLDKDLATHAEGVMKCIHVPMNDGQKIAYVDTAYNIGVAAFCGSSMARYTNAGDAARGCQSLNLWIYQGKEILAGLVRRRALMTRYCLGEVKP